MVKIKVEVKTAIYKTKLCQEGGRTEQIRSNFWSNIQQPKTQSVPYPCLNMILCPSTSSTRPLVCIQKCHHRGTSQGVITEFKNRSVTHSQWGGFFWENCLTHITGNQRLIADAAFRKWVNVRGRHYFLPLFKEQRSASWATPLTQAQKHCLSFWHFGKRPIQMDTLHLQKKILQGKG